jgi:hypothetical protein
MLTTWVLIVFAHVGPLGDGNSNAFTSVPGFAVQAECDAAGRAAKSLADGTVKKIGYACVQQTVRR